MTTVLGRTVNGEITRGKRRKPQKPGKEFLPLLDAVLAQPNVHSVRWNQYTPYFNDGEPCIFGIESVSVKLLDGNPEDGDKGDGYIDEYGMTEWVGGSYKNKVTLPEFQSVLPVFKALEAQMEYFEDFLQESFGDHAEVTATKTGFDVEFYEHD